MRTYFNAVTGLEETYESRVFKDKRELTNIFVNPKPSYLSFEMWLRNEDLPEMLDMKPYRVPPKLPAKWLSVSYEEDNWNDFGESLKQMDESRDFSC